jgi:hypothetical protein
MLWQLLLFLSIKKFSYLLQFSKGRIPPAWLQGKERRQGIPFILNKLSRIFFNSLCASVSLLKQL